MAPLIHVPVGVPPTQVEFPPEVKQRSCKGALHLRPASTKEITAEELAYLKADKKYAKLAARVSVVEVRRKPPRAAKPFYGVSHVPDKQNGDGS